MSAHVVADVVFADESTIICACGEDVHHADEDELVELFQAHRVAAGEQRRIFASSEYKPANAFRWRETPAVVSTKLSADYQRAYRKRNKAKIAEAQRAYRARRREEAA